MKIKHLVLTLLMPMALPLMSCSENKIHIDKCDMIDSFVYVDTLELTSLINENKDFVLVLGELGCTTCDVIKEPLKEYIKENRYLFYWIEQDEYFNAVEYFKNDQEYSLRSKINSATILFFNNGKTIEQLDYNSSLYSSKSSLFSSLNKRISSSNYHYLNDYDEYDYASNNKMYRLNLTTSNYLDNQIATKDKIIVDFSWKKCPDCSLLNNSFLNHYLITSNKQMYIFETHYFKTNSEEGWTNFKNKYYLSNYGDGYVPSLITYEHGNFSSMAVYVNDKIEKQDDNTYKVTRSFWKEKIEGLTSDSYQKLYNICAEMEIPWIKEYMESN